MRSRYTDDECLDKPVAKPLSPCKATTTLVIEATNIQVGKLLPIELANMSLNQIVILLRYWLNY